MITQFHLNCYRGGRKINKVEEENQIFHSTTSGTLQHEANLCHELSAVVNIASANSSIGRRLREAGMTLKESVEMAKRSTSDPKNWNSASAISESSMTSNLDPEGDQDPVNILERDTRSLVAMDLAKSPRQKTAFKEALGE